MDPELSIQARQEPAPGSASGLKLVFRGTGVKHLLNSGRKPQSGTARWRQEAESEQQEAGSPSQGAAAVSDSAGRPFSPSSQEPSPDAPEGQQAGDARGELQPGWAGPRSVHGHPPGKQPYPDDRTPEAEAARAQLNPQHAAAAPEVGAAHGGAPASRSIYAQPPGKQPHPDDPSFQAGASQQPGQLPQQQQQQRQQSGGSPPPPQQQIGPGGGGMGAMPGPRSVHGQPPGKNADQIYQIAASAKVEESDDSEHEDNAAQGHAHLALQRPAATGMGLAPHAPWRQQQQHHHVMTPASRQVGNGEPAAAAATAAAIQHGHQMPAPAASSHQGARQRSAPPAPGGSSALAGTADKPSSRKRPSNQLLGADGGGQPRKKAANGSAVGSAQRVPAGAPAARPFSAGVPASLARTSSLHGSDAAAQTIRPMPGAPRSLQQRQQLVNGATAASGGRGPAAGAGASRPKQPGAPKAKQQSRPPGSGQKRPSSNAAGAAPVSAAAPSGQQYRPGDVVWAKIGVYPWWPAQLQRPTADEHFKPKHAATDLFCVFYGSNDYNWLPASALKPFTDSHPDYLKHASVKNKALQRAIDEAWVYGVQRQRPDVSYGPAYGGA